ncbi:hypothetical protein [Methanobrevibacter sp.]|uniref:hypothetical protein n=1 Tax=Methanobrevibacter sp. TaxID=66852 RepID=UPI00388E20B7
MNKNYLIIGILVAVIAILCCGIGYMFFIDHTEYVSMNIPESGTAIQIPNDMSVKSNNSETGVVVMENDNTIIVMFNSADKGLAAIMAFATIKNPIFGTQSSGNITLNNPRVEGCSLDGDCNAVFIGNNETHDNIIVISKNKGIVSHIIDSIIWGKTSTATTQSDTSTTDTSSSQPSAYAYKSDGTPMYSQSEVDKYMENKYGDVDYHVGGNGYIDMDEPGYDDAGNVVDN